MVKRTDGKGTITPLPDSRFRARGPRQPDGSRPSLGIHETQAAAERALEIGLVALRQTSREGAPTFATIAESVLDEREKEEGIRDSRNERNRYVTHLATARFASKHMKDGAITSVDVAEWLREMGRKEAQDRRGKRLVSKGTIQRALSLASSIFDAAGPQGRGLMSSNPCTGLEVKKRPGKEATKDAEVFLTLEEQLAVRDCQAIPDFERWLILFAFGCGVRMGEQHNAEITDVDIEGDDPGVWVRYGSDGLPRKNGSKLWVPLFGFALEATRAQLALLKGQANPLGLLFPTSSGCRRKGKPLGNGNFRPVAKGGTHVLVSGKPRRAKAGKGTHRYVDRFKEVLALAGITRHVRWHDLRHSCASALLQGQWGDAWTLRMVQEQLGHSSITVTERYAHLGETAHKKAARKVRIEAAPVVCDVCGLSKPFPGTTCVLNGTHPVKFPVPRETEPVGHALVTEPETNGGAASSVAAISSLFDALGVVGRAGHDPATYGLKGPGLAEVLRALAQETGSFDQRVTNVAARLAREREVPSLPACRPTTSAGLTQAHGSSSARPSRSSETSRR